MFLVLKVVTFGLGVKRLFIGTFLIVHADLKNKMWGWGARFEKYVKNMRVESTVRVFDMSDNEGKNGGVRKYPPQPQKKINR